MEPILVDDFNVQIDHEALREKLRLKPGRPTPPEVERLLVEAQALAHPRAAYLLSGILARADDEVQIEGQNASPVTFTSRVLRINLDPVHRLFPYLVTAGGELDAWARAETDLLTRFYADQIQEHLLHRALHQLTDRLREAYGTSLLASQSPGSLTDWPLSQQVPLFALFGAAAGAIGVQLQPSLLMTPAKTISGFMYESENGFASCQLCPRENCSNRRQPYDPELFDQRYAPSK
ncbi:MAG: hypothetical protein M5U05_12980 [Anaerolineales bacterium]|jgi:hypothetical protein|nr:hypothetical protein [Anaerolineales bacterium]